MRPIAALLICIRAASGVIGCEPDHSITVCAQELLTCNKLSELACLTLYMMYEKLRGKESRWCVYALPAEPCHSLSASYP